MKNNTLWLKVACVLSVAQVINTCSVSQDCSATCDNLPCSSSKNTWFPRAFSSDASREITLEKTVFQTDSARDEWNGTFSVAAQYGQNFGSKCASCKNLGSMPFWGAAGTNVMTIGNNGGEADVDGWNFGLGNVGAIPTTGANALIGYDPAAVDGSITINPKITQAGADLMLYFVHKKDERGLYFKVNAPIASLSVDPQMTVTGGEAQDVNAFMQTTTTTASAITYNTVYPGLESRYQNLSSAFAGGIGEGSTFAGHRNDDLLLNYGKISTCKQTAIRLADLSFVLGYNLFANDKGLFALGFKTTCPTGDVPTARYMLEPIVGRGGVWGVGADIMGHYKAWENDAQTKFVDIWLQGEVLHLASGRRPSMRSFDLKLNGAGSKYLLLQRYHESASSQTFTASGLTQAINITTLPVFSKFAVEGNAALMVDYHCNNWNIAVSGEFWGRTKETLSIDMCSSIDAGAVNFNHYAVVGRQASVYNVLTSSVGTPSNPNFTTNLCEPLATINESQNTVVLSYASSGGALSLPTLPTGIADATNSANRIPADITEALDICGAAAAKAFTGKVFGQLGYTWSDSRYTPNISVIGGAEFTNNTNNAVSMWSAGLQGSLNF